MLNYFKTETSELGPGSFLTVDPTTTAITTSVPVIMGHVSFEGSYYAAHVTKYNDYVRKINTDAEDLNYFLGADFYGTPAKEVSRNKVFEAY